MERVLHPGTQDLPSFVGPLIQALDAVPVAVTVVTLDGTLVYVNQRTLDALGYTREELLGRPLDVLLGNSLDASEESRLREKILAGGWRGELTNVRKDGSAFPILVETNPIRDESGKPLLVIAVARDITEQRAFQRRMVAEAKQGTFGVIAHNVAHEVRNRLAAIKMSLYMLEADDTPAADRSTHFAIAREELNRIALFVHTLDNYANPPRPVFEETDLLDAVNRGLEDARPLLLRKSVTLLRQYPSGSPRLRLDRDQFSRAVFHVIENSCEAVGDDGEIHVVVKRQPRQEATWWLVEIRDNGAGIPPHLQQRVMEPFFTTTKARLGLGLSNIQRILELHGGRADVSSQPGRGTTVILKLPERPPAGD